MDGLERLADALGHRARRAARRDRAHRPRHDRRDQCAARAQGRAGRAADHRRPSRRPGDARGPEGRPLRSPPAAARAAGAAPPAARRTRAHPRRRPDRDAARSRCSLAAAIAELARAEVGRRRGLLPARLARRPARAADRGGAARGHAVGLCLALLDGVSADQGVRAGLHHGGQRLRRPGAGALSRPPRDAPDARRATAGRS